MSPDQILKDESDCRLGVLDPSSPTCLDAVPRVLRDEDGGLLGVFYQPINISQQSVAGYDLAAHYRWDTAIGMFRLTGSYLCVRVCTQVFHGLDDVDRLRR